MKEEDKARELINMVGYVLEKEKEYRGSEVTGDDFEELINYAKFLSMELALWMFISCDKDGNIMEEPDPEICCTDIEVSYPGGACGCFGKPINKEWWDFKKAKQRVIFEGFTYDDSLNRYCDVLLYTEKGSFCFKSEGKWNFYNYKKINDLTHLGLVLTQEAVKKYDL